MTGATSHVSGLELIEAESRYTNEGNEQKVEPPEAPLGQVGWKNSDLKGHWAQDAGRSFAGSFVNPGLRVRAESGRTKPTMVYGTMANPSDAQSPVGNKGHLFLAG